MADACANSGETSWSSDRAEEKFHRWLLIWTGSKEDDANGASYPAAGNVCAATTSELAPDTVFLL
jgi:hypothetical protein